MALAHTESLPCRASTSIQPAACGNSISRLSLYRLTSPNKIWQMQESAVPAPSAFAVNGERDRFMLDDVLTSSFDESPFLLGYSPFPLDPEALRTCCVD